MKNICFLLVENNRKLKFDSNSKRTNFVVSYLSCVGVVFCFVFCSHLNVKSSLYE